MQTFIGPFQPHLEDALAEQIRKLKTRDIFCPLLIVVPSDALRRHLKKVLAAERKLSLLNLQLLTFHQLSLKLFAETHGMDAPKLYDDLFYEEALRQLIRAELPGTLAFAGIDQRAGGSAALWQTLRDLRDALVDPAVAREALSEGHFASLTSQRTGDLLTLLEAVLRFFQTQNILDHAALDRAATARVHESAFLAQFRQIFYYGFYDLTQVQLDFFHAVAEHYPATVLFPLIATRPPHDGWSFAERFYQSYVQGRGGDHPSLSLGEQAEGSRQLPLTSGVFDQDAQRVYRPLPDGWSCTVIDAFGIYDEVGAVAKEILRLLDDGVSVDRIGVVARSLDGYGPVIKEVFHRHHIPMTGGFEEPLIQFPLTKAAILLLNLAANDYPRSQVLDLLAAPFFNLGRAGLPRHDLRPDLWDLATRELAICKGMTEWARLERFTERDLVLRASGEEERRVIPAEQLRALLRIVRKLAADLARLPARASWKRHTESWGKLLKTYLGIGSETTTDPAGAFSAVAEAVARALEQVAELDAVPRRVSLQEFCQTLQHWLERGAIATSDQNLRGVAVLNAGAARGLSFHALFIVGLNEGVFPRTIREDAFLRDRDREVIERDLGYKISQKLAAFDEEKLLFSLLVNSARERLYCSFQRADEDGRVLAPSWYLAELRRAIGPANARSWREWRIARSIADKSACEPFNREELLLPEELAIRLSLAGKDAKSLISAANLSPDLFNAGTKAIEQIDLSSAQLNRFDGMVAEIADYWERLSERGISPTSLEVYGRCPFQYFVHHVIGLEPLEAPEESAGPSFAEYGELGHEILKNAYRELIDAGYFTAGGRGIDVDRLLRPAAAKAFDAYEASHPIGYPLTWEIVRETLTELVGTVLRHDLKELAESGYVPVALEASLEDRLSDDWPEPLRGIAVRGRIDRLDLDPAGNRLRIVDYKFKLGAAPNSTDRDLDKAALRGRKLQPPIYSFLGGRWAERNGRPLAAVEAAFFYIAPYWREGPLTRQTFSAATLNSEAGAAIKNTINDLLAGIRSGRFFMQRGEHCQYCQITELCRKNHPPSLWRAENDPLTRQHRHLRDKDPRKS